EARSPSRTCAAPSRGWINSSKRSNPLRPLRLLCDFAVRKLTLTAKTVRKARRMCCRASKLMANRPQKRLRFILALALLPALCGACAARRAALVDANTRVLKVKVTRDGDIYLDGRLKTLDEAEAELGRLKREHGAVLYYREENAQHQPH